MRWILHELTHWWREYTRGLDLLPVLALLIATVMLLVCGIYGGTGFYRRVFGSSAGRYATLAPHLYWYGCSLVGYAGVPLLVFALLKAGPGSLGLRLGDWRLGLKVVAVFSLVMVAVVAAVLQTPAFAEHYPLNKGALAGFGPLLVYETFHMGYFFAWEFIFRGFLLFALYPALRNWAILVQMIPFAILHLGKPAPEVFASVFAGIILGALALRTRSMLYCWLLHGVSALAMDVGAYLQQGQWRW